MITNARVGMQVTVPGADESFLPSVCCVSGMVHEYFSSNCAWGGLVCCGKGWRVKRINSKEISHLEIEIIYTLIFCVYRAHKQIWIYKIKVTSYNVQQVQDSIKPTSSGKCSIHYGVVFWKVSTYRWLHKCLVTMESISRLCDLTWVYLSLSFGENIFFTNAINTDAVIIIIIILIFKLL